MISVDILRGLPEPSVSDLLAENFRLEYALKTIASGVRDGKALGCADMAEIARAALGNG